MSSPSIGCRIFLKKTNECEEVVSPDSVDDLSQEELCKNMQDKNIFSRVENILVSYGSLRLR